MRLFTRADNYDAFDLTKHLEIYRLAVISVRSISPLIFKKYNNNFLLSRYALKRAFFFDKIQRNLIKRESSFE